MNSVHFWKKKPRFDLNIFTWCWLEKKREGRWPYDLTDCVLVQKKTVWVRSVLTIFTVIFTIIVSLRTISDPCTCTCVHKCSHVFTSAREFSSRVRTCVTARHVLKDGIDRGRWLNHRSSFDTLFHSLVIYHLNLMKLPATSGNCEAHACPTAILSTCVSSHNSRWTGTWSLTWLGKERLQVRYPFDLSVEFLI